MKYILFFICFTNIAICQNLDVVRDVISDAEFPRAKFKIKYKDRISKIKYLKFKGDNSTVLNGDISIHYVSNLKQLNLNDKRIEKILDYYVFEFQKLGFEVLDRNKSTVTFLQKDHSGIKKFLQIFIAKSRDVYSKFVFAENIVSIERDITSVYFDNPSFEGKESPGYFRSNASGNFESTWNLDSWVDCGSIYFETDSPPNLHSAKTNYFKVKSYPSDGETFLDLVVRANNTYESISQEMNFPFKKDSCYSFKIDLKTSPDMESPVRETSGTRVSPSVKKFDSPTVLNIYLGNNNCDFEQLAFSTEQIFNEDWKTYQIDFVPEQDFRFIGFQAYYANSSMKLGNGNLLMDNIHDLRIGTCPEK